MKPADKLIEAIETALKFGHTEKEVIDAILEVKQFFDKDRTINTICDQLC